MGQLRSRKQERTQLVGALRTSGKSWIEVAAALRQRYRVNARVAFRYAHGWSQRRAAEEWNRRWPDELKTFKNFSYWEQWPSATGYAPSFDNLSKLAELYECSVSDLLVDLADFRHLDPATNKSFATHQIDESIAMTERSPNPVDAQWTHHSVTFAVQQITGNELPITSSEAAAVDKSALLVGSDIHEPLRRWLLPVNDVSRSTTPQSRVLPN